MILMEDEQEIWGNDSNEIILTTHRVRQHVKGFFNNNLVSLMLEDVTSCQMTY
jgi:hypothetical protein